VLLTVIIPAYNASKNIENALRSIWAIDLMNYPEWSIEVIVVNDGSEDGLELQKVISRFEQIKLIEHQTNLGMCAARNTGISASHGDYVTLLDADDEYIEEWYKQFLRIIEEWPSNVNVILTPCLNDFGELTCQVPGYKGYLTAEDIINERYSGEYNPIFRGDYIRAVKYVDLGTHKSCGLYSYLKMARQHPFWITDRVQRIYHTGNSQSVTSSWTNPSKAKETYICFDEVLKEYQDYIKSVSLRSCQRMKYKRYIYCMLAGYGRNFRQCFRDFSIYAFIPWIATCILLIIGPGLTSWILLQAKKIGILRKYG
jgi:glycosyltransferase involved in cell wall biosynthesis